MYGVLLVSIRASVLMIFSLLSGQDHQDSKGTAYLIPTLGPAHESPGQ